MSHGVLGARLVSVAELVRQGAVFADVGTDHAHLPIFLLSEKIIDKAFCTDINRGPLDSAKRNAERFGLLSQMEFILCDGAHALLGKGITDYAICGMGGELIAGIIDRAPHLKEEMPTLILQPMTKQAHLRQYLFEKGFSILTESYSSEGSRHYVTMVARYTGIVRKISPLECEIGTKPLDFTGRASQIAYLRIKLMGYKKMIEGKISGGESSDCDREIMNGLAETIDILSGDNNKIIKGSLI